VFFMQPSQWTLRALQAEVGEHELLFEVVYPDDAPVPIRPQAEEFIERLRPNLQTAQADIAKANSELEALALAAIAARRQRIIEHREHIAQTGLPVDPREVGRQAERHRHHRPVPRARAPGRGRDRGAD
jgi:hypothetical protein